MILRVMLEESIRWQWKQREAWLYRVGETYDDLSSLVPSFNSPTLTYNCKYLWFSRRYRSNRSEQLVLKIDGDDLFQSDKIILVDK